MVDHLGVIESEGARIVAALDANRTGRVPWSDRWSVAAVARHVGQVHHVVAQVVAGRPDADFGVHAGLSSPESSDPGLGAWLAEGTGALTALLRATDPDEPCWSWSPLGTTVGFWHRRMAQETLVHRWDAQAGAEVTITPIVPALAADGVDEYLDVFAPAARGLHGAPAGPSIGFDGTDTGDCWRLDLLAPGASTLTRGTAEADVTLRGPAEGLLLTVWGRLRPEAAGVDLIGDAGIVDRWADLLPPM